MAVPNPFSITYGSLTVGGGSSTYLLNGPYIIDKSFTHLRLVFEVVVVAGSYGGLQSASDQLETDFSKRDQDLTINLSGSEWEYMFGENILVTTSTCQKTGNKETDRGHSRAYTCVVEGELPATDKDGLRDLEVNVNYAAGRQRTVSMRGLYTAIDPKTASEQYLAEFDAEAGTILSAVAGSAVMELVSEEYPHDRLDHLATFTRQYTELLADQSQGGRDDDDIKDHRMTFTDLSQHPGDALENIYRLRRVIGTYDCAIDIEETTDLHQVFKNKVRDHVLQLFRDNFDPQVFAVEDSRVSYDESLKRLSVSLQFIYQKSGGEAVIEVSQSVAYRESRTLDVTPLHNQNEFAAEVDVGWAILERVWSRTVVVMGSETPKRRIGERAASGPAGPFGSVNGISGIDERNTGEVSQTGWNVVANTSQVSTAWIGDPDDNQMEVSTLTETVIERYNAAPAGGIGTPGSGG